jgi:hypothetical protein
MGAAKRTTSDEKIGSESSELPGPVWYLEQFRSHIGTIHQLFKYCPPQQWKTLSLAIGDALAEVGKKIGLKVDHYVKPRTKSPKKNRA